MQAEKLTLNEIYESIQVLEDTILSLDPDDHEACASLEKELLASLDQLGEMEVEKVDAMVYRIDEHLAKAAMLKEKEAGLRRHRQAIEKSADRIKEWMRGNMEFNGVRKINADTATVYFGKSQSVDVPDPSAIPAEFQKATITADKARIKKILKTGEAVPGAALVDNETFVIRRR